MNEEEARACFLACVQAGAIVQAIRYGRSADAAIDAVAAAWRVPIADVPRFVPEEPGEAAREFVAYHLAGGARPDWLPR
jgi:hypothetical protein